MTAPIMPETFEQTEEQPNPQLTFMNSGVSDVYTLLGVTEMATMEIIHRNFLRKVRKLLKSLPEGSLLERAPTLEQLRVLWIAHDILTDPVTRADYDLRLIGLRGGASPGGPDEHKASEFGGRTVLKIGELLTCAGLLEPTELEIACDMHKAMPEVQFGRFLVKQGFIQEHQLEAVLMGQKLLRRGCITVAQYQAAMDELESSGVSIAETVVERGYVTEADLKALDEAERMESQPHLIPIYVEPVLNQDAGKGAGISQLLPPPEDTAKTSSGGLASILSSIPKASDEAPQLPPKPSSMLAQILSGDHIPALRPPTHEPLTQPEIDFSLSEASSAHGEGSAGGASQSEGASEDAVADTESNTGEDIVRTGDPEVVDPSTSTLTLEPVSADEREVAAEQPQSQRPNGPVNAPDHMETAVPETEPEPAGTFSPQQPGDSETPQAEPVDQSAPPPGATQESSAPPKAPPSTGAPPPVPDFARPYPILRDEQATTSDRIPVLKQAPTIQLHGTTIDDGPESESIEIVDSTDPQEDRPREIRLSDAVPSWKDQLDWSSPEAGNSAKEEQASVPDTAEPIPPADIMPPDEVASPIETETMPAAGEVAPPAVETTDPGTEVMQAAPQAVPPDAGQEPREINLANAVPAWKDQLDWSSPPGDSAAEEPPDLTDEIGTHQRENQETLELEPIVAESAESELEVREIRLSDAVPSWKDQLDWGSPELAESSDRSEQSQPPDELSLPEGAVVTEHAPESFDSDEIEAKDSDSSKLQAEEFDASPEADSDSDSSPAQAPHTVSIQTESDTDPAQSHPRRSDTGPLPVIAAEERLSPPGPEPEEMSVLEQIEDNIMEFLTVDFSEDEAAEQARAMQAQSNREKTVDEQENRKSSGEFVFQIDTETGVNIYTREDLTHQEESEKADDEDKTSASDLEKVPDEEHGEPDESGTDAQSKKLKDKQEKHKSKKRKTR